VLWPAGFTAPFRFAVVAPVIDTDVVLAEGAPAVRLRIAPVAVPAEFVALMATQYFVFAVRPVMTTVTLWKLESVKPSAVAVVELAGEPVTPWLEHQVEVARS
jgi:hypothetical protein